MFLSIPAQKALCWLNNYRRLIAVPQKFSHLVDFGKLLFSFLNCLFLYGFGLFSRNKPVSLYLYSYMYNIPSVSVKG